MPDIDHLELSGVGRQLGFVLREASIAVWNDVRRALEPASLRPQTYATLLIVDTCPGCKQGDVADALGIRRPNMVAVVDELVGQGLIARDVNSGDRRSYALSLTAQGRAVLKQGQAAHHAHEQRLADVLDDAESALLLAIATKLSRM